MIRLMIQADILHISNPNLSQQIIDDLNKDQPSSSSHLLEASPMHPLTFEPFTVERQYPKQPKMKSGLLNCGYVKRSTHRLHRETICT